MDSGVWPERRSFNDEGMRPIPSRWKGKCDGGESFPDTLCNKKLIGARFFDGGHEARFGKQHTGKQTARDAFGHGTHTASLAAGRRVENASFLGYAYGASSGIVPKARLAIYKICCDDQEGCYDSDILACIDAAVDDGIDGISISLGLPFPVPLPYDIDPIAIGAFGVIRKGVVFSAAAGNSGTYKKPVSNAAPWITTVGASTLDRTFPADIVLGDGRVITGSSLYDGKHFSAGEYFPLIYAGNATKHGSMGTCLPETLDPELVKEMYQGSHKGIVVKEAGGVGVITTNVASRGEALTAKPILHPGFP
ncbi:Subtilisin-like protease [Morus notabilis]|uniref:Subtilisin-like protease n=1 Tax=Morus notabilis TaxID=981085 RepID=W9RXP3_9ROSA|nr:subtilisin-like protease SBT1.5 [Morus notabilis]EXC16837.1 Subtilisin-like protease [Morus notabilis]